MAELVNYQAPAALTFTPEDWEGTGFGFPRRTRAEEARSEAPWPRRAPGCASLPGAGSEHPAWPIRRSEAKPQGALM